MLRKCFAVLALSCLLGFFCLAAFAEGEDDPLWNKHSYEKKLFDIGQRILAANGITERIGFYYDQSDIRNAEAQRYLSDNTVRVYKDLLDMISSDDELAAVLSHEIAHITHRHEGKATLKAIPVKVAEIALAGTIGYATLGIGNIIANPLIKMGGNAVTASGGRNMEKEADLAGLDYMVKAGYNPLAMETVMTKVAGDGGPVTTLLNDHPMGTARLAYIHEAIKNKYPQYLTAQTANNPVPGAPYALRPNAVPANQATPQTASVDADRKPEIVPDKTIMATKPEKINYSLPVPALKTPPEEIKTPEVKTTEIKTTELETKKVSAKEIRAAKKEAETSQKHAEAGVGHADPASQNNVTVAQLLLDLNPAALHTLKLINKQGYMTDKEILQASEHPDPEMVAAMLDDLIRKRLIRTVGDAPNEGYVLTEWAAKTFENPKQPE